MYDIQPIYAASIEGLAGIAKMLFEVNRLSRIKVPLPRITDKEPCITCSNAHRRESQANSAVGGSRLTCQVDLFCAWKYIDQCL